MGVKLDLFPEEGHRSTKQLCGEYLDLRKKENVA
jgi:hypothetical protein